MPIKKSEVLSAMRNWAKAGSPPTAIQIILYNDDDPRMVVDIAEFSRAPFLTPGGRIIAPFRRVIDEFLAPGNVVDIVETEGDYTEGLRWRDTGNTDFEPTVNYCEIQIA